MADDDIDGLTQASPDLAATTAALNDSIISTTTEQNRVFRKWMKRLIVVNLLLVVTVGLLLYRSVFVNGPILHRLDDQQVSLDKLTSYVEEAEANRGGGGSPELQKVFIAIFETREIICVIPDPEVQKLCADLSK
jgi:hypothetical protein